MLGVRLFAMHLICIQWYTLRTLGVICLCKWVCGEEGRCVSVCVSVRGTVNLERTPESKLGLNLCCDVGCTAVITSPLRSNFPKWYSQLRYEVLYNTFPFQLQCSLNYGCNSRSQILPTPCNITFTSSFKTAYKHRRILNYLTTFHHLYHSTTYPFFLTGLGKPCICTFVTLTFH